MPTYEFNCQRCGNPAKKKISAGIGLIFRGSGFYITDYRKPEKKRDIEIS